MPTTSTLSAKLATDFPELRFLKSNLFHWSAANQTVYFVSGNDCASLLHETAHGLLGHRSYRRDVQLLGMERDAWQYAIRILAPVYQIKIDETTVEDALDTYRDWLHARSTCPGCAVNGLQVASRSYRCLVCGTTWRVNAALSCGLKRYQISQI